MGKKGATKLLLFYVKEPRLKSLTLAYLRLVRVRTDQCKYLKLGLTPDCNPKRGNKKGSNCKCVIYPWQQPEKHKIKHTFILVKAPRLSTMSYHILGFRTGWLMQSIQATTIHYRQHVFKWQQMQYAGRGWWYQENMEWILLTNVEWR